MHVPSSIKWDLITCFCLNLRPYDVKAASYFFLSFQLSIQIIRKVITNADMRSAMASSIVLDSGSKGHENETHWGTVL